MGKHCYEALRANGKKVKGEIEADGVKSARSAVRALGLIPLTVAAAEPSEARASWGWMSAPVLGGAELASWTRQLAGLIMSGLTIERALLAMREESEPPKAALLFSSVAQSVQSGASLATALAARPDTFGSVYVAVVAASEEGGHLGVALAGLAKQLEAGQELRSKVISASLYPAVVSALAVCIVAFLIAYVVPQVAGVFAGQKRALPWLTRAMLALSHGTRVAWPYGLTLAVGGAVWARRALRVPVSREAFDAWTLRIPGVGRLIRDYNAAAYGSTLAMLAGAGVPIVKALVASAETLGNHAMRRDAREMVGWVRDGASLGGSLARLALFPKLLSTFASLGEKSGDLPSMLERASNQLGADVQRKSMRIATLLEPLLIVAMGGIVMVIVASVLLPIVQMSALGK